MESHSMYNSHNTQRLPQRLSCLYLIFTHKQRQFIFGVAILRWLNQRIFFNITDRIKRLDSNHEPVHTNGL